MGCESLNYVEGKPDGRTHKKDPAGSFLCVRPSRKPNFVSLVPPGAGDDDHLSRPEIARGFKRTNFSTPVPDGTGRAHA